jgi:hypothetical protein
VISSYEILSFPQANDGRINVCQLMPKDRGERSVAAGARAHRWFKLGSDHEKSDRGALDVAGETLLWRAMWQSGGASLSSTPLSSHFQSPHIGNIGHPFN